MDFLIVAVSLAILLVAGDMLVKGAVNLSLRLGVPALIVSLTIVAFGTSAPELLISVQAVMAGVPGIALGNVVGSNVANVLLVLGIPAIIAGIATSRCEVGPSFRQMLAATVLFIALCFLGPLTWWHGLVLLAGLALMLGLALRDARASNGEEPPEGADPDMRGWRIAAFLLIGLIGLPLGADLLVDSSSRIARAWGMSDAVIGLTLVAVGTSLPELATTVMAAFRRQAEVALGNVIGSNMFNLLAIMGIAVLVGPVPVGAEFLTFDLWVMLGASLLLIPFVSMGWDLTKRWGVMLVALYAAFVWIVVA